MESKIQQTISSLDSEGDALIRASVASNTNTPPEVLAFLCRDSSEKVRQCVAQNPNTPINSIEFLCKDTNEDVKFHIVKDNPNLSESMIRILFQDTSELIRRLVASSSKTPVDILEHMSAGTARAYVAGNLNTPTHILGVLSTDDDILVRAYVAENENTPSNILAILTNENNIVILSHLCKNRKCPSALLQYAFDVTYGKEHREFWHFSNKSNELSTFDGNKYVWLKEEDFFYFRIDLFKAMCVHQNAPVEAFTKLASDLRITNTDYGSDERMKRWANDGNRLLPIIAQNPIAPVSVLKILFKNNFDYPDMIGKIEQNPNFDPMMLGDLVNEPESSEYRYESLVKYISSYPKTPPQLLERMYENPKFNKYIDLIVKNPQAPISIVNTYNQEQLAIEIKFEKEEKVRKNKYIFNYIVNSTITYTFWAIGIGFSLYVIYIIIKIIAWIFNWEFWSLF